MSHKVLTNSVLTIGGLKYTVDNGQLCLLTGEGTSYRLSGQQTHALYNLLCDYRLEIIAASVTEQRERERSSKPYSKKPEKNITDAEAEEIRQKLMQVFNGGVEAISELEAEQEEQNE